MALTPATGRQTAENSILDTFYRQTYLGNSYIVPTTVSLATTNETNIILIQNTQALYSSVQKGIFVNLRRFSSSAQQALIKTYVGPTVSTTSTSVTPNNLRPANANTSIATVYQNGNFSLSSNGTLISSIGCAADDYVVMDNQLLVILDPGQSLLITATALVEPTSLSADVSWYEI